MEPWAPIDIPPLWVPAPRALANCQRAHRLVRTELAAATQPVSKWPAASAQLQMQAYPGTELPKGESLWVCESQDSPHLPSSHPSPTPPLSGLPRQHFPRLYSNSNWFQGYNFIQSSHLPNRRPLPKDAIAKRLLLTVEPVPLSPQAGSYIMSCRGSS